MSRKFFHALVLYLVAAMPAGAETMKLTVGEAIALALNRGTPAQLTRSNEQRARIAREEALSGLLPQADARFSRYSQSINLDTFGFSIPGQPPVVGPFNVTDAQVAAAMQLFNLAAIRRYRAVQSEERATRYATEQAENDVAAAVARLYLIVARAQTQIASRQADVALFDRLVSLARDEFKAGTGTRLDVAQASVQAARAKQAWLVAQNDRQNAALALLSAIGADQSGDVVLTAPPSPPASLPSMAAELAAARAQRPELKQLAEREKEAELLVGAARARLYPSLGVDFEGDLNGNRSSDLHWTRRIAGTIGVPIFRGELRANIARAQVGLNDAHIQRAQAERDVEQDVRRALASLQNAEARMEVAGETASVAEEALTVARDRKAAGFGSTVEVDRAQDTYRQAREDRIAAQADAAAAQFDLDHATGNIRRLIPAAGATGDGAGASGSIPFPSQTSSGVTQSVPPDASGGTSLPPSSISPTPLRNSGTTPATPPGASLPQTLPPPPPAPPPGVSR